MLHPLSPVVDPGEGAGGPAPPLYLDQTEARRAEKKIFETSRPPPLSQCLDDHPPPLSEGLDLPLPSDGQSKTYP